MMSLNFRLATILLGASAASAFVNPATTSSIPVPTTTRIESSSPAAATEPRDAATIAELKCEAGGSILDEAAMLKAQNFPVSPEDLVSKAKHALVKDSGVLDPSLWAEDFEFCAPYVGPLSREKFLEAANGFKIYDAFPDFDNRYFNIHPDPIEPGRVWFMTRLTATNDGAGLFGKKEPSNKNVVLPPQMYSFLFNEEGLIRELTVGYPVDRRQGNTGGLGGMFGVFYGIGQALPFPEGKPYQLSRRFRFFNMIGDLAGRLTKKKD
ncbi:unnamed protein product [Pseudo-nitzschia multistriata]|uniref:SnoaL-like domain-containing protein n=1 Tax=Pseudo-nitzschia multistriata TaxID=183589 RepID=A0A448ZRZ8_9STRA|nr:unnamed protein product [Pseudo-nitzschia multistriata]